jgi:hypothetical protein
MKYFLILFFVSSSAMAQKVITLPMQDGKVFYEHVYEDNGTKNDLFIKAKDVFLRLFPDTKDVIQNEDKGNGIVAGKGNFELSVARVRCTIRILVKDNKYKVQIFDFYSSNTLIRNDIEKPIEVSYDKAKERTRSKNVCNSWIVFNDRVHYIFDEIETEMNKKLSTDF